MYEKISNIANVTLTCGSSQVSGICGFSSNFCHEIEDKLPKLTLEFSNVKFDLPPAAYLFDHEEVSGYRCALAIRSDSYAYRFGAAFFRNYVVALDYNIPAMEFAISKDAPSGVAIKAAGW